MRRRHRTDWAKRANAARRHVVEMATTDARDVGVRRGVVERLGLEGEREQLVQASCGCELPPAKVFTHLAWLALQRDRTTGQLPFGVY